MINISIANARQKIKDFGTSLKFDGTQGSISLGTSNPFTGDFYFGTWIQWNGLNGSYQTIFAKRDSYASDGLMFSMALVDTTGVLIVDTVTSYLNTGYKLPRGKKVYLTWVHDVTNSLDKFYIDGVLIYSVSIGTLGTKTDAEITIGACQNPTQEWFNGIFDEIVIGLSAPTQEEVIAMRNKYIYDSLWTYLKCDEGSGFTATDSSGNGNDGIIVDATYVTDKVLDLRASVTNRFLLPTSTQKSLYFNGTSDYANFPITPSVTGFSVGFFIKRIRDVSVNNDTVFSWSKAVTDGGFDLRYVTGGRSLTFNVYNSGSIVANPQTGSTSVGKWDFVVATYKVNEVKIFLNSEQKGSTDTSATMTENSTSPTLGKQTNSSKYGNFLIKNLTFQNTATPWTTDQIEDLYWRNIIPSGATQWSLNNVATDQNGENALTLTGTSYSDDAPFQPRDSV